MKFKIGDEVRLTWDALYDYACSGNTLQSDRTLTVTNTYGYSVSVENKNGISEMRREWELELVPKEPEFRYGEIIEVRNNVGKPWEKRIFVGRINSNAHYPYICVEASCSDSFNNGLRYATAKWELARKLKSRVTRKEIAERLGISEDFTLED